MAKKAPAIKIDGAVDLSKLPDAPGTWGDDLVNPWSGPEAPAEEKKGPGALRSVGDTLVAAARGAIGGTRALTDLAGADNRVSKKLRDVEKAVSDLESAERSAERRKRAELIKQADEGGDTWDQVKARMGGFFEAPIDTTAEVFGSSAPTLLAAAVPGAGQAAAGARIAAMLGLGAGQGAGAVKGQIYDSVKQGLIEAGVDPQQAEQEAVRAQEYGGQNTGQIGIGAALGAAAGTSGLERSIGRIVTKEGVDAALLRRMAQGAVGESIPEGLQGAQEQLAGNLAEQNVGLDTPAMRGVIGAGVHDMVASAGPGAVGGMIEPGAAKPPEISPLSETQASEVPPAALPPAIPPAAPPAGPIEAAVRKAATARAAPAQAVPPAPVSPSPEAAPAESVAAVPGEVPVTPVESAPMPSVAPGETLDPTTGEIIDRREVVDPPAEPGFDGRQTWDSLKGVQDHLSQMRRSSSVRISAKPVKKMDGSYTFAIRGEPEFSLPDARDEGRAPEPVSEPAFASQKKAEEVATERAKDGQAHVVVDDRGGFRVLPADQAPADAKPLFTTASPAFDLESVKTEARKRARAGDEAMAVVRGKAGGFEIVPAREIEDGQEAEYTALSGRGAYMQDEAEGRTPVQAAAAEAATSPHNDLPEPTEAQREAGNFKQGHVKLHGLDITIQYPEGSKRTGTGGDGKPWEREIKGGHYGHIRRTTGGDGEQVDVYVGPHEQSQRVFVIPQTRQDGSFDEHKVVLGVGSKASALRLYRSNMPDGWKRFGKPQEMSVEEFKEWVKSPPTESSKAAGKVEPGGRILAKKEGKDSARSDSSHATSDQASEEVDRAEEPAARYSTPGAGEPKRDAWGQQSLDLSFAPDDRGGKSGDGHLDATRTLSSLHAPDPDGVYGVRTQLVAERERQLPVGKIATPEDAATALHYVSGYAVEHFEALVTDKGGKPLGLVGSFKGAVAQAQVHPETIMAEASRLQGAANIWFTHNHPSGTADFSAADRNLYRALRDLFRETGIEPRGLFAQVSDGRYVYTDGDGEQRGRVRESKEAGKTVPVLERVIVADSKVPGFSHPEEAQRAARDLQVPGHDGPILMLLGSQNQPTGAYPLKPNELTRLRTQERALNLFRSVSLANARNAIVVDGKQEIGGAALKNLTSALAKVNVSVLDVLSGSNFESAAAKGTVPTPGPTFLSRAATGGGQAVQRVQETVGQLTKRWKNAPKVRVIESLDDAPQWVREAKNAHQIDGFVVGDTVHLVADKLPDEAAVRRVLFHESLGHRGLRGNYGKALDPLLDMIAARRRVDVARKARKYGLDMTKAEDRREAAEELLADFAQTRPEMGFVQRAVAAIRSFLRGIGIRLALSDADIVVEFILPARRYIEDGRPGRAEAGWYQAVGEALHREQTGPEFAAEIINELAGNPDLFQYPISQAKTVEGVVDDVTDMTFEGDVTEPDEKNESGADEKYLVKNARGQNAYVYVTPKTVWMDVSRFTEGTAGQALYAAIGDFAFNTRRTFIGDPAGLSDIALRRRTEAMISSALRHGTTRHLEPHPRQIAGSEPLGVPPLPWKPGDDFANLQAMIEVHLGNVESRIHEAAGVRYDFGKRDFADSAGRPVDLRTLAAGARGSSTSGEARAGYRTLARHALLQALVRGTSEARPGILRAALHQSSQRTGGLDPNLRGLFSRSSPVDSPAFQRWFGDSKVVDADGEPLVVYHGTAADFSTFTRSDEGELGQGFYFATSADAARQWGLRKTPKEENGYTPSGAGLNVMPVFVALKNPASFSDVKAAKKSLGLDWTPESLSDRLKERGFDGVWSREDDEVVAFRPEQIKSATGNTGAFDPANPDIRFSRGAGEAAMQPGGPSPTERQTLATGASNFLLQAFKDSRRNGRTFKAWRGINTQYHKATLDADFKRVFDAAQSFSRDVSKIANEAADMAPTLLPNIANLSDIARKSRVSEADLAAVSKAVFEGTLADKDPGKGKAWSDEELSGRFGMNERQIALYHEFRAAVTKSLDDFGKAELLRFASDQVPEDLRDAVLEANDVKAAAEILADALGQKLIYAGEGEQREIRHLIDDLRQKAQRVTDLKDNGYAPLMRFGQYAVWIQHEETIEGKKTMVTDWFSTHESLREANRTAREMMPEIQSEQPGAVLKQGIMSKEEHKLFAGVTPDTLEVFGAAAGFDGSPEWKAYIELVKNNRSALKRMLERKGTPGFSQDLSRVLAGFITSNARASAGNIHSGAMIKAVEAIPNAKGDVKDEAVRLVEYLRDGAEEAQALRGLMFNWFLGGSIASAAVNLTQPLTMTLPYLAVKESAAKATARLTTAVKDVLAGRYEKDLAEALQLGEKEGVVEPQEMHALQAEVSRNLGSNLKLRKFLFAWGYLFQAAERFNRRTTFVAAYRQARDLKVADPFAFAEEAVIETQGVYAKHNRPNWARGAVGATLFTFKQYSIAYIEFVARLLKHRESRPAGMLAIGILIALSGVSGLPGAEDLDDIIDTLAQAAGYNFQADEAKREFLAAILGEPAAEFLLRGVSSTGIPIDIQQRMGLGNLVPATAAFKKSSPSATREAVEVFGAAGGLGQKVSQSITAGLAGDAKGAGAALMPVAIANALKAYEMAQTGQYRDTKGRRVTDVQMSDAIWKGIGFQPADVGKVNRREGDLLASGRVARLTEAEIAGKWAQGLFEHDDAKVQAAREALWSWNQKNRDTPIKITGQQLKQRVKQMQMTRAERIVKSSPKELRQMAARSLQESR